MLRQKYDDAKVALAQPSIIIILICALCDKCSDINVKAWKTYRGSLYHSNQRIDDNWFRGQASTGDTLVMLLC